MGRSVTDEHLSLRLIGWYGSTGHGFSVPLFGQIEGANTLYIARCSISGDHQGTIAEFEPVDVGGYERLPVDGSILLAVGEPWHDVFVWNGISYVGTPEELWQELQPYHSDLVEKAPLSFLDLALYADRAEVQQLAPLAFAYVDDCFDRVMAQRWRMQLLRQWLETELRRTLAGDRFDDETIRSVAVEESAPVYIGLRYCRLRC